MASCEPPNLVAQLYQQLKLPPESEAFPPDAKCIRLLDIFSPENVQDSSPLEGRLRITNLADNEPFTALSYVWGIDKEKHSISISETQVPVSANGNSALVHLRKKLGAFTIWIDAICIDQTNQKEKERQIPLMGEIYSSAAPAYLWLGEGDERSDRAMELLGKTGILDCFLLDAVTLEPRPKPLVWRAYWRLTRPWRNGDKNPVPRVKPGWFNPYWLVQPAWLEHKQASYEDINHLLSRTWIRRIWTLQEVLLTKHAIVVCGDLHVPWLRFACSLIALQDFSPNGKNKDLDLWNNMRPWKATAGIYLRDYSRQIPEKDDSIPILPKFSFDAWPKFVSLIHTRCRKIGVSTLIFTFVMLTITIFTAGGRLMYAIIVNSASTEFGSDVCLDPRADVYCTTRPNLLIIGLILSLIIFSLSSILSISTLSIRHRLKPHTFSGTQLTDLILDRDATNPKDKAFGVHSILQRSFNQRLADPNYQLATEQIYADLCLTVMSARRSLRVLDLAVMCPLSGYPTWIPDWNKKPNSFWMSTALASWRSSRAFWKYEPPRALIVQARQLAIVKDVLTFEQQPTDIDPVSLQLQHAENLRKLIRVTKDSFTKDRSGRTRPLAHYMSSFWNLTMSASESPLHKMRYDNFDLWVRILARLRQTDADHIYKNWRQRPAWVFNLYVLRWRFLWDNGGLTTRFVTNVPALSESLCTRLARNDCSLISWRTQSGELDWALSTSNARTGDKIVAIHGAGIFAIRGQDDEACLVGLIASEAFECPEDHKLIQLRLI